MYKTEGRKIVVNSVAVKPEKNRLEKNQEVGSTLEVVDWKDKKIKDILPTIDVKTIKYNCHIDNDGYTRTVGGKRMKVLSTNVKSRFTQRGIEVQKQQEER